MKFPALFSYELSYWLSAIPDLSLIETVTLLSNALKEIGHYCADYIFGLTIWTESNYMKILLGIVQNSYKLENI